MEDWGTFWRLSKPRKTGGALQSVPGAVCTCLVASGRLWEPLEAFESLWKHLGTSWERLGALGLLWEPLGAFGNLRESFGSLWQEEFRNQVPASLLATVFFTLDEHVKIALFGPGRPGALLGSRGDVLGGQGRFRGAVETRALLGSLGS